VGIWSHMSEYGVWVVAEVLALEWKGGRGWGYGRTCPNMEWVVVEVLVLEWKGIEACMSEHGVWVVAEALVLEWKGKRGWGYGRACPNTQVKEAGVGGG